jgi:hypothetical protein
MGLDEILRRCMMEVERPLILKEYHEGIAGGHYTLRRRFCKLAFGGLRYIEMLKSMPDHVVYARELEKDHEEMKFH